MNEAVFFLKNEYIKNSCTRSQGGSLTLPFMRAISEVVGVCITFVFINAIQTTSRFSLSVLLWEWINRRNSVAALVLPLNRTYMLPDFESTWVAYQKWKDEAKAMMLAYSALPSSGAVWALGDSFLPGFCCTDPILEKIQQGNRCPI